MPRLFHGPEHLRLIPSLIDGHAGLAGVLLDLSGYGLGRPVNVRVFY